MIALKLLATVDMTRGVHLATVVAGAVGAAALALHARRVEATERARALGGGGGGHSRLPSGLRDRLDAALAAADVRLDAGAAAQVWLLAAVAAGCLSAGLGSVVVPVAICSVLVGGPVALYSARHRGARRRTAALPTMLELVASELRTGGTVGGALETLGRGDGPLAPELARLSSRRALGASLESALASWAGEHPDSGVSSAAGAFAVAALTGGRAADALDGLASSLRDRSEIAAESRALSAQARLSAMVVGSLPVVYLAASTVFDARQVRLLTNSTFGLTCLAVGLTFEAVAALWIRALLRQEH